MTSSHAFPVLTSAIDPSTIGADAPATGLVGHEWYAPHSTYYQDSYGTPFPSSTLDGQPWPHYQRMSVSGMHYGASPSQHPHSPSQLAKDASRPRSSPSTFGPSPDTIPWTTTGLGIQYTATCGQPTPPVTSTFPPNIFQTYAADEAFDASSPPDIKHPQPRRPYPNIAPNPAGLPKRKFEEDEPQDPMAGQKRRKRTSSVASQDLSEDDRFLVQLKEDENLPWKDIAHRFHTDKAKTLQVAALQMRYKRLREKFRVWDEQDVHALRLAHEYWEKYKWEIISTKMIDFGLAERWPPRLCARKWTDLEASDTLPAQYISTTAAGAIGTAGLTPASLTQFSSPTEGPVHFAFVPLEGSSGP